MIVKNEEHIIEETLECMKKYIDYYIIADTGSTDNTKLVIKNFFDKVGIEGEIHDIPWKDFGVSSSTLICSPRNSSFFPKEFQVGLYVSAPARKVQMGTAPKSASTLALNSSPLPLGGGILETPSLCYNPG